MLNGPLATLLFRTAHLIKAHRRLGIGSGLHRATRPFIAALDHLSDLPSRRISETREKHAKRLSATAPSFVEFTEIHLRLSLAASTPEHMPDLYQKIKNELESNLPRWKRWLGFINPIGWYFTR